MMESIYTLVKSTFPKYLKNLPLPENIAGFADLTGEQWLHILPFFTTVLLISVALINLFLPERKHPPVINTSIKKDQQKVADIFDIEDLAEKQAFCRCWKSKKFPYCDGSHNRHNQENGDNIGPLVLKHLKKEDSEKRQ